MATSTLSTASERCFSSGLLQICLPRMGLGGARRGRPQGGRQWGRGSAEASSLGGCGLSRGPAGPGDGCSEGHRVLSCPRCSCGAGGVARCHADPAARTASVSLEQGPPGSEQAHAWEWAGPGRVRQRLGSSSHRTCSQAAPPAPVRLKATGGKGVGRGTACPCQARLAHHLIHSSAQPWSLPFPEREGARRGSGEVGNLGRWVVVQ